MGCPCGTIKLSCEWKPQTTLSAFPRRFNSSVAKARYRNVPAPPPVVRNAEENMEHFGVIFNMLLSIIDHIISTLPNSTAAAKQSKRGSKGGSVAFSPSVATLKQLEMLREPMDWVGQVFCNTVRPLLLIQGKWSYQVRNAIIHLIPPPQL